MEHVKLISEVGYEIGEKANLHEFEILRLLELIKYNQYNDFIKIITSIARTVKVTIPIQIFQEDFETFECYIHALWEGFMKSCKTFKLDLV